MPYNNYFISTVKAIMLIASIFLCFSIHALELDANEIMSKNHSVTKVSDSVSDATFILTNNKGKQRIRKSFGTTKLQGTTNNSMRMTRFLSPGNIKGTVTLLIEHSDKDDDIWIYLPALKKVRRLVSSNKKKSFVGTDFSYGDVLGHKVNEWNHQLIKEEDVEGKAAWLIESIPASDTIKENTGYSKRLSWILKENFVTVKGEYYDSAGVLLKTARYSDIQLIDELKNKWQAMMLEAKNEKTGHQTVIQFENFKANQGIDDDYFTTRYMEQAQ